jgi:uncharacterized membrane protein
MIKHNAPSRSSQARTGEPLELLISRLLRGGVALSMLTVLIGVILMFAHHPEYLRSDADLKRLTTPGAAFPHALPDIIGGVRAGRGQATIAFGLLLLVATPILQVVAAIPAFIIQRDYIFAVISAIVCAALLCSFLLGKVG